MKHLGDITKLHGGAITPVDIICGGSPCQDLSVAGKRAGITNTLVGDEETTRSGLFYDMVRVVKEMRDATSDTTKFNRLYPRFVLWENVPGALSATAQGGAKGTAFQAVLTEFIRVIEPQADPVPIPSKGWSNCGAIVFNDGHSSIAWRIADAQFYGVPQRRRRIALLCDYDGLHAPEIVFEQYPVARDGQEVSVVIEGVSGDSQQSIEARKGIAGDTSDCVGAGDT